MDNAEESRLSIQEQFPHWEGIVQIVISREGELVIQGPPMIVELLIEELNRQGLNLIIKVQQWCG